MSNVSAVHKITTGNWHQNGYVVEDDQGKALIIDPGADAPRYIDLVNARGLSPLAILNTHAHYDHLGAVCELITAFGGIPFYLHSADRNLLRQTNLYRSLFGAREPIQVPSSFLDLANFTESRLTIGQLKIECLATPGHTRGSVCFRLGKRLFSGDTLLPNGPGRTDLPGGSAAQLRDSVQQLLTLPGNLTVYPGHGKVGILADIYARTATALSLTH